MYTNEKLFKDMLRKQHLYCTSERINIFRILNDLTSPCSINDLVDMTTKHADRSTVYRTIGTFEEVGITNRINIGKDHIVELSDKFSAHHHHMTCSNCNTVISFEESESFDAELKKLEQKHGFKSTSHSLELKGLCASCC